MTNRPRDEIRQELIDTIKQRDVLFTRAWELQQELYDDEPGFSFWPLRHQDCPDASTHRGPEGPNEDIGQCRFCGMPGFAMRSEGETFGHHLEDCSLPINHESYCVGGGAGHPEAKKIRG